MLHVTSHAYTFVLMFCVVGSNNDDNLILYV